MHNPVNITLYSNIGFLTPLRARQKVLINVTVFLCKKTFCLSAPCIMCSSQSLTIVREVNNVIKFQCSHNDRF